MRRLPLYTLTAAHLAFAQPARAEEPQSMLAHVELVDESRKVRAEHAVFLVRDSGPAELDVLAQDHAATRMKLQLTTRGALSFQLEHVDADTSRYSARGEISPPPTDKKVLVARIPHDGKPIDVLVHLTR
jgi:hypothetical protein